MTKKKLDRIKKTKLLDCAGQVALWEPNCEPAASTHQQQRTSLRASPAVLNISHIQV
jgi:hypothetical protein